MPIYERPLKERIRHCERQRERRWGDPAFRLRLVNYNRERRGREPYQSVDEIQTRGSQR